MRALLCFLALILLSLVDPVAEGPAVTLVGSNASMVRQHEVARRSRLYFVRTPVDVARLVETGHLVPVPGNADYTMKGVDLPFAHPALRAFVERTAGEFRRACGERLVVTSLVRPTTRQPPNAHALSVHPAGIAVDLSIPDHPTCRWLLARHLLALESQLLLDATEEKSPPHLHVAIFPAAYLAYEARLARDSALFVAREDGAGAEGARRALLRPWLVFALVGLLAALGGVIAVRYRARRRR